MGWRIEKQSMRALELQKGTLLILLYGHILATGGRVGMGNKYRCLHECIRVCTGNGTGWGHTGDVLCVERDDNARISYATDESNTL